MLALYRAEIVENYLYFNAVLNLAREYFMYLIPHISLGKDKKFHVNVFFRFFEFF